MMINNSISTKQASEFLSQSDNILLLCHKNPDGDTIGSAGGLMYALKKLGKCCAILCQDRIPDKYDYLKLELYRNQFIPEAIVSVDVASAHLLGEKTAPYNDNVDLCIDHHPSNTSYAKMTCCDGSLPATAQLMLEIIENMGVELDKDIANCLYTGIMTDTGCFKYSATSSATHIAGAKLIDAGADHTFIANRFFMSKSRKNIMLEKYALNTLEFFCNDRCAVVVLTKEILDEIQAQPSDIEGISAMPRAIEGVDVGLTIRQLTDSSFKISIRTSENINACEIAEGFGGGGHTRAAGCEVMGSLECVKKAILREVETALCK